MSVKTDLSPGLENQRNLLRRAFAQNDGRRVISLMLDIKRRARQQAAPHLAGLFHFLANHEGEPQAIRALNILQQKNGSLFRFKDVSRLGHNGGPPLET